MINKRIVAVGLLTQEHLDMLRGSLTMVYPIDETPCFRDLINAIDEADRAHWRADERQQALRDLKRA